MATHTSSDHRLQLDCALSRRLRVAFVAPSLGILGGQAVQADRLLRQWRGDADVDARLVPVNPVPPGPLRAAARVKYVRTLVTEATYLPRLIRELRRADVAHVFCASYSSFLLAPLPAILVAHMLGKPVVLNYRSGQAPDHLKRSRLARWALARVELRVVPSRFLVDVFSAFGIDASIIPNIVDFERFGYRERDPLRPRLLSTRNFDDLYNVTCTLRAFRLVQHRRPEAELTLVGGGPQESRLRALAAELRLEHVTFTGRVDPDEIARFYDDHDIYVQSPDIDNMPTSVIEAYASGLPVVSTEAGGVPAILTDGVDGFLAPVNDHDALAARVLDLLDEPDRARHMARHAHDTVRSCTWTAVREQWLDAYWRAIRSTRASGAGVIAGRTAEAFDDKASVERTV
jgi:glycosyltransferase involved in cell wall biosynthesis